MFYSCSLLVYTFTDQVLELPQPPEDWCWPICSQHETNGSVRLRFV